LLVLAASAVQGQEARIQGRVHNGVTGDPVPRALVRMDGTRHQARADTTGAYQLAGLPAGPVSLRVEAPGFVTLVEHLDLAPGVLVIVPLVVTPVAVLLDHLSIGTTAPASPAPRADVVTSDQLMGQNAGAVGATLTARVPGATVIFAGGSLGTATQILLRGVKSLSLPGDPLYYLDGVRAPPPTQGVRGQVGQPSILDLVDDESIERIEVLRGAAAVAAFGLGANNGVILVFTKR